MRFASIAFVKHVVKHTVYKRSRQGSTPGPHKNQKSGSPCPITPPELETLSLAGPRCAFLGLHRVGGYRGNEIFFMCEILRTLGRIQCQRILFSIGVFRRFGRGKGPFPAGRVLSLPCRERGLPRASTGLCARVCVSFPPCPGTPRVKPSLQSPLF